MVFVSMMQKENKEKKRKLMFVTLVRDTCSPPRTRDHMAMRVWGDLMPTFMGGPWVSVNYTKFVTHDDKAFKIHWDWCLFLS